MMYYLWFNLFIFLFKFLLLFNYYCPHSPPISLPRLTQPHLPHSPPHLCPWVLYTKHDVFKVPFSCAPLFKIYCPWLPPHPDLYYCPNFKPLIIWYHLLSSNSFFISPHPPKKTFNPFQLPILRSPSHPSMFLPPFNNLHSCHSYSPPLSRGLSYPFS